ncbi:dynamin-like GTPase family protein [Mycolicibacterium diernhoferi]|uniref:Isoniazid-inducible protein iniC n=1 Tax=Mycolicibacterium diernhoferi TaxID=1801 RepID=A0A1Q4HHZ4_9MYCO|nr:dynamin-like GTPase family protein [Mycolicibacterium diernhoferi]OJZ67169.1 Isoniazid-inducible protein iniC [Mycolicibacterium diernhoferi]OPE46680.1 Isoniazid-inducible protein iniC [Mycolicibacterium diernhoferi]PEG52577.1 Isoniazid-inducible protein iniC [Mycolicibacterium diernhoferi]QYL23371.1 dynamin-like GTPase family protein [Mycolicibacterium diernhoferi]
MSTSDTVRAILGGTIAAYRADPAYRQRPDVHAALEQIGRRLNEPMRIALAGTLKAGKSTLVNALVGEDIAPTDATEATRIVTRFRHGPSPKVTANHRDGSRSNVPIARAAGEQRSLTFSFAGLDPDGIEDLDVEWPAAELIDTTIIDTPGTSSLSRDVSQRTLRLLVPEDGVPRVDAVVFLLRTLNAADIALLKQIGELVGGAAGSAGALGVIGVASRADEIGAGRIDAMLSARDVATRFTAEMDKTGICQAVVPVSGLLALTARTLRQSEFVALEKLAGVPPAELAKAMLSADRFVREDSTLPVDAATRAALLERFGMFGIRISVAVLSAGISDSVALADELLERSGLIALRDVIDQQFAQRSDLLKAHTALLSLRRFVEVNPVYASRQILADIDPLLADAHAFEELRLLSQLRSRETTLTEDEMASLRRLIGGSGTDAASRLGLGLPGPDLPSDDGPRAAFAATQRWRRRAEHPLNDPFTSRACRAAVRSAEALVAEFRAMGR